MLWTIKCSGMGVSIELQNLGDAQLCREITAHIEHAFADRRGDGRVSIAGSRASENWEMRLEGPNGFEPSYTLAGSIGEHEPDAIRRLVLQLILATPTWLLFLNCSYAVAGMSPVSQIGFPA